MPRQLRLEYEGAVYHVLAREATGGRRFTVKGSVMTFWHRGLDFVESGSAQRFLSALRRGWFFGSQEFREMLLKLAAKTLAGRAKRKADGYQGAELGIMESDERNEFFKRVLSILE